MREHRDRVVLELAGHDHFASLRSHTDSEGPSYHNLFVAPSISPWYYNNPGVTSFEISDDLVPQKLRSTFLNLATTIGQDKPLPLDQLEFRELDFAAQYGVEDMTAESILELAERLSED